MKIDVQTSVIGDSLWNMDRNIETDELLVTLNIGDIDEELQDAYVRNAEDILHDRMSDEEIEYALSHVIWEKTCQ